MVTARLGTLDRAGVRTTVRDAGNQKRLEADGKQKWIQLFFLLLKWEMQMYT